MRLVVSIKLLFLIVVSIFGFGGKYWTFVRGWRSLIQIRDLS